MTALFHSFVVCCLIHLLVCQRLGAERLEHRRHQRRTAKFEDERFLNFRFAKEPQDVVALPTQSATFDCHFEFPKKPQSNVRIEWRKDGVTVSSVRQVGRILIVANGSLVVENVLPADEGAYQCVVHVSPRNPPAAPFTWTFLSRRAWLRVPDTSVFEQEPTAAKARPHQPTAFHCILNSFFPGTVEWYKDDRRIYEGDGYLVLPKSQSLEIKSVHPKHAGQYKCVVREPSGIRQSKEVPLAVVTDAIVAQPISFISKPRSQTTVDVGTSFILECLAVGSPKPRIRWLKDALPLSDSDPRIRRVGADGTSLFIEKAVPADSGEYTCRAENGKEAQDASATVAIRLPPVLGQVPHAQVTQETADVEFECSVASGVPRAGVSWFKNGERIVPSEYFVVERERLKILGLVRDDQGVYQCIADNEVGSVQASAQLVVDPAATHLALNAAASTGIPVVPTEPLGLKVTKLTGRVISMRWDPPLQPGGEIVAYHVFFREEDSTRERTVSTPTPSVTINDLQPSSVYVIRITAENRVGPGKSTPEFKATTAPEQLVPSRVRNLRAKVHSSVSVEVMWDAPSSNIDSSLRYRLYYIRKDRQSVEEETQVHMVKTSYVLHDLDKDADYLIRVEADSANGQGPSSESILVRTFTDVPSKAPENVRGEPLEAGSIRVSWQPPHASARNGAITGYKIKFKTRRRGSKGSIVVVDGDPGEYTLNGLESGTPYTIRMAAINQNGTGPFTDWIEVDTPIDDLQETFISAPRSLKVQAGHDAAFISWEPPVNEGAVISGFEIGWGLGVPDIEKARVDANQRSYTIKGLKPSREYVVSLRGFNNFGPGFPIYETVLTSAYGPVGGGRAHGGNSHQPTATPLGVRAETESSSAVRVSWTDPNHVFNPLYTVRYASAGDNHGNPRFANTSENEFVVKDLRPNMLYEFAVRLVDSVHWSMTVANRTDPAPPSSAPRDLTVVPPTKSRYADPNTVTLNWQPPKYANGEVSDYSVLYTHRPEQDDREWLVDSVRGDQLSMTVRGLVPQTVYYFKIQARNVKGIGPFSPIVKYEPEGYAHGPATNSAGDLWAGKLYDLWESNKIYVVIGVIAVFFVLVVILVTALCVQRGRRSTGSPRVKHGYAAGRKQSAGSSRHPAHDFWIVQGPGGSARPAVDYETTPLHDLARHDLPVDSPPPRYQCVQGNGTISRSYHHSSTSLEGRQRTPQVVYTATARQPIAKVEFGDHASSYGGSSTALQTPPPQGDAGGYRSIRTATTGNNNASGNPLRSFAQLGGGPPPLSPSHGSSAVTLVGGPHGEQRTAQIVRPIIVAPNSNRGSPLNGPRPFGGRMPTNTGGPPVGRATAQPRVNVAGNYYASSQDLGDSESYTEEPVPTDLDLEDQAGAPMTAGDDEDLHKGRINEMLLEIQQLQHELTTEEPSKGSWAS